MGKVDGGMQALSRAVLGQARADADAALAGAESSADGLRRCAQQQAEKERAEILERAGQEADRIRSQSIAAAELKARTLTLGRREELLTHVLASARQRLPTAQQWTDYDQIVRQLAYEALAQLGAEDCLLRADRRAREILAGEVLTDLSKELGMKLQLAEALDGRVGVIAATSDGHLQYDNTLEARMERLQDGLRFGVYRLLMGEPE